MNELIGLTILEQIRLLTPYFIYSGIIFICLLFNTIFTIWSNRRRWKREEEKRLPEIVRRKLFNRDKLIVSLRSHIGKQDTVIERYSVAVRAASLHNHKVAEILQLPMINEAARRKRTV